MKKVLLGMLIAFAAVALMVVGMTGAKTIFDIKSEQVTFDRIDRGFKGEYLLA